MWALCALLAINAECCVGAKFCVYVEFCVAEEIPQLELIEFGVLSARMSNNPNISEYLECADLETCSILVGYTVVLSSIGDYNDKVILLFDANIKLK